MTSKDICRQLFERFTAGDVDGVLSLLADDVVWTIPGKRESNPVAGDYDKERLRGLFTRMQAALENGLTMTVTGMVAEDDRVAAEVESSGDLRNGRQYRQRYHFLMVVRDGRIATVREYLDTQHVMDVWVRP
jgi:uncharacterized protein